MTETKTTVELSTPWGLFRVFSGDAMIGHLTSPTGHQGVERDLLLSLVRSQDVVVDVGAHIGSMTVPLARAASKGKLVSVEAMPDTFELLRQNVELNKLDNVVPVNALVGIGNEPRTACLDDKADVGGTRFVRGNTNSGFVPRPLSAIVSAALGPDAAVDVMKIDVEGMEPDVLRSAEALFGRRLPIVMLEVIVWSPHRRRQSLRCLRRLDDFFESYEYNFHIVLGHKHGHQGVPAVGKIKSFKSLAPFWGIVVDVIAIPRSSNRSLNVNMTPGEVKRRLCAISFRAAWPSVRSMLLGQRQHAVSSGKSEQ